MKKMESDNDLLKIMDHLDGFSRDQASKETLEEAADLKQLVEKLRALPTENSNPQTDKEFYTFLKTRKNRSNSTTITPRIWAYVALAASLALLVYLFLPKSLSERYQDLDSNVDKVGFIYTLNGENISDNDYLWLVSLLEREENPNIRVTLIDLIGQQPKRLPLSIADLLTDEEIPAVQMAILNNIDQSYNPDMKGQLLAFNNREDLDEMVRERIVDILSEK